MILAVDLATAVESGALCSVELNASGMKAFKAGRVHLCGVFTVGRLIWSTEYSVQLSQVVSSSVPLLLLAPIRVQLSRVVSSSVPLFCLDPHFQR